MSNNITIALLAIAVVIALSVRPIPAEAEPNMATITYDCAPADIEMSMPIAAEAISYE